MLTYTSRQWTYSVQWDKNQKVTVTYVSIIWYSSGKKEKSALLDVIAFTSTSETKMHHFCQFSMAVGGQNGDFETFVDFEKTWVLWDLLIYCIFENNSLKALFGQNMKKLKILTLSPNFRYLQKLALNFFKHFVNVLLFWNSKWASTL